MDVDGLVGSFVVEVGVRQAWSFIGFCDNRPTPSVEARLYVDAGWSLGTRSHEASDDIAWLTAVAELNGETVISASVSDGGSLHVEFTSGDSLEVSGQPGPTTVGEPWWLAPWQTPCHRRPRAINGMCVRSVWHDPWMDRAYCEEIAGQLHALLVRPDDRLPGKTSR